MFAQSEMSTYENTESGGVLGGELCGNIQGVRTLIANQPWLGLQEGGTKDFTWQGLDAGRQQGLCLPLGTLPSSG